MMIHQVSKHYKIRYNDVNGCSREDNVYALDAMEAQCLAMEFNDELMRRPHCITAILLGPD